MRVTRSPMTRRCLFCKTGGVMARRELSRHALTQNVRGGIKKAAGLRRRPVDQERLELAAKGQAEGATVQRVG